MSSPLGEGTLVIALEQAYYVPLEAVLLFHAVYPQVRNSLPESPNVFATHSHMRVHAVWLDPSKAR